MPIHKWYIELMLSPNIKTLLIILINKLLVLWVLILPGFADTFMYIDSKGILHFTNVPISSGNRIYLRKSPVNFFFTNSSSQYDQIISKASLKYDISFYLLKAIIKVESDFNPKAISKAGAKGLMQIMPINTKSLKINNIFDPKENIMGGTKYLKKLLLRFCGKVPLALAAYNAGPSVVNRYNDIPPIKETQVYVNRVMKYYYHYSKK